MRLFEGIAPLLEELRRREVKLGLVSSKTREQYARTFQRLGFDDAFVQIICADLTEKHKPYPEPIEKFFELTGLPKQGAVYIGDTVHDCACAHGAGIAFGLSLIHILIVASTGIFSPGRTTMRSPGTTCSIGMSSCSPPRTTRAVLG